MSQADSRKLFAGALLLGASALPLGSFVAGVVGGVGGNWVAEALGGVVGAPAPAVELGRAYERALRRAVNDLRREYQRAYGSQETLSAFDLLRESAGSVAGAEPLAGAASIDEVQAALVRGLDGLLYGHPERQVSFVEERLLEQMARAFHDELASSPEAWRLFNSWLLERLLHQSAQLGDAVARLPALLARLEAPAPSAATIDAAGERLDAELAAIREELRRIAAGRAQGAAPGGGRPAVDVGGGQTGDGTAGDLAGGNIYKGSGPIILGNITSGRDTNIADRQTIINRDEPRRPGAGEEDGDSEL
ncbi:MAG: hypothetical protein HGA45_01695 [Chloroflexales bacterium]|nr:hypothetical protein [Chloroflexales bacterium]